MLFEPGLVLDLRRPVHETASWRTLGEYFLRQVERPDLVQLLVTDRYEHGVQAWQRLTPPEFGDQGSAEVYASAKVDGTRAAAKTVVLSDHRAVVVAAAGTLDLGADVARWMLTHESQHVRMHQADTAAWGVHRRSGQEIVSPRPWAFVWAAQNAIDEYRCEKAVHARLPPRELTYGPDELRVVVQHLREAREIGVVQRDLEQAYQVVTQALDRLAVLAAYSAAAIVTGRDSDRRWASGAELAAVWSRLWRIPDVDGPSSHPQLWRATLDVSESLDSVLRRAGVELTFTDDELALYFS